MTNLRRRLKKLEGLVTDSTGLVPNSPKWFEYWRPKLHLYTIGQLKEPTLFPAEIIVDWIRSGDANNEEP
jgi:hypothetical protein